jgi:uncharacterized membrane protein YczE
MLSPKYRTVAIWSCVLLLAMAVVTRSPIVLAMLLSFVLALFVDQCALLVKDRQDRSGPDT